MQVLLVEDSAGDACLIENMLVEAFGDAASCQTVQNLADCLHGLSLASPDVILLDLRLPDCTGVQTLSNVLSVAEHVPVIVLTGIDDDELAVAALHEGAQDFLAKGDVDARLLRKTIRYAIERKQAEEKTQLLLLSLQQSEERFRQLADHIDGCVWMLDARDSKMLYVSPSYETIWGRSTQSLFDAPSSWLDGIHHDDRERVERSFSQNITKSVYDQQYRVIRPDGSLRWVWDRGVPIRDDAGEVYRLAGIAQDITVRKILEKQIHEISTHEQHRIAHELHDGLGQELTGLSLFATSLAKQLVRDGSSRANSAEAIAQGIQRAIGEVRDAVKGLVPVEIDAKGLPVALAQLVATTGDRSTVDCRFRCDPTVAVDDRHIAHYLFRIAQEAINNAVKHAEAKRITVSLEDQQGRLELRVQDDGRGIDPRHETGGLGLRIMEYRCDNIGATFDIQSKPGRTTICCSIGRSASQMKWTEEVDDA